MGYIGKIVFLVLLSSVGIIQGKVNVRQLAAAKCQPWRVPVEVQPGKHTLTPYYVEMHRCLGQCTGSNLNTSPLLCECAPKDTQNVTIKVVAKSGYSTHVVQNHTSCVSQCKASNKNRCIKEGYNWKADTCECQCLKPASGSCPKGKVWNAHSCRCECPNTPSSCSSGMFWNESTCSCQCSIMAFIKCSKNNWATNLKTCRCERRRPTPPISRVAKPTSSESETKLVVSLVVIGLLLGTLFIIDLVLMCSKKGFMYGLVTKCSEKKEDSQMLSNQIEAETGSITINLEGKNPVANGNCKHKHLYAPQGQVTNI